MELSPRTPFEKTNFQKQTTGVSVMHREQADAASRKPPCARRTADVCICACLPGY